MNKIMTVMKKFNFAIALLVVLSTYSQNYKGTFATIQENGLHKIILPTNVRATSHDNFNFLRIKNSKQEEVPYVLLYNIDKSFSEFTSTKILTKNKIKDSVTSIIIENKKREKLEKITLKIANTQIVKKYDIYGSENNIDWFGLVANKELSYYNSANNTILEKTIHFPLNNYKFLRIDFNDKKSLPINILETGFYKSKIFTEEPIEINGYTMVKNTLKDKKITQLKFSATKAHQIDLISFDITSEFFLRNAKVIITKTRKVKKRTESYEVTKSTFRLNSRNKNTFYINNLNVKEFTIEIENQDNPPLSIEKIQLLQKPVCLIANLKQKESYEIHIDTLLKKPSYDLGNFISNKTDNVHRLNLTNFSKIDNQEKDGIIKKSFWQTNMFMWLCIILGGILVVFFALSLLKDISNKDT